MRRRDFRHLSVALLVPALAWVGLVSVRAFDPVPVGSPAGIALKILEPRIEQAPGPRSVELELPSWLEVDSQEGVREVVRFCQGAGVSDIALLRAVAVGAQDPLVAGNAVRALGRLGVFAGHNELVALVHDERLRVRQEAIVALGMCGEAGASTTLETLLTDGDPGDRPLVLQALGRIGGRECRSVLAAWEPHASEVEQAFLRTALSQN